MVIVWFLCIILIIFYFIFLRNISSFRQPTGYYNISSLAYHWIDTLRKELNDQNGKAYRELMAYIYYPAHQNKNNRKLYDKDALGRQKAYVFSKSKVPKIFLKGWDSVKTYTVNYGEPIPGKYPVILISNSAETMIQHYTWLLEEITSHGYIVIGINHPYMAGITKFPDNRIIKSLVTYYKKSMNKQIYEEWKKEQTNTCALDIAFVLNKLKEINQSDPFFKGKLDLEHIGIIGHSFAADIALLAGSNNNTISTIVNLDGGTRVFRYNRIKEPFTKQCLMILTEKSNQWRGEKGINDLKSLDDFVCNHKQNVSKIIIKDVGHDALGDLPILLNITLFTRFIAYIFDFDLGASASKGCKAIDETAQHLIAFLNKHLTIQQ